MKFYWITALLGAFLFISCGTSKVYFTQTSRERIEKRGSMDLIQFYTDRELSLIHTVPLTEGDDEMGDLESNVTREYYVIFPKGTPCIAEKLDDNRLKVFFEEGDLTYLIFKSFDGGFYGLAGYYDEVNEFHVSYDGDEYNVESGGGVYLMRGSGMRGGKTSRRVVKGVRIKR